MTEKEEQVVSFQVDSMILEELGERLAGEDWVALGELVKNSYDADATIATVEFRNINTPDGTIVVSDNGSGITVDDFHRGWMTIGSTLKKAKTTTSKFQRTYAGKKGIGRFACRRIAKELHLESISGEPDKTKTRIEAAFDWASFEGGQDISTKGIKMTVTRNLSPLTDTGTILELKRIRESWDKDKIGKTRRELVALIAPFPWEEPIANSRNLQENDPGMKVNIVAPDLEMEKDLAEDYFDVSWGTLEGWVDEQGVVEYSVVSRYLPRKRKIKLSNLYEGFGTCYFKMYFFSYKSEYLNQFSLGIRETMDYGRKHGGVRIFYDGFRVPPYGQPGDDWLSLERDRGERRGISDMKLLGGSAINRSSIQIPGNSQLFGVVYLSRITNPEIEVAITRDKLVHNDAVEQLTEVVRKGIDFLTIQYARWTIAERKKSKATKSESKEPLIEKTRNSLLAAKKTTKRLEAKVGKRRIRPITKVISTIEESVEELVDDIQDERVMLRVLSSTGTMVALFVHEIDTLVKIVDPLSTKILASLREKSLNRDIASDLKAFQIAAKPISNLASFVLVMLSKENRSRRQKKSLFGIAGDVFNAFETYRTKYHIEKFENDADSKNLTPAMYQSEIYSILLNLLTNAIKAVRGHGTPRKIRLESLVEESEYVIRFMDNGKGLDEEKWTEVFEPFVTYSDESDVTLGYGTGLGLTIVRDIVSGYRGTIRFISPIEGWKTCLEIRLPK